MLALSALAVLAALKLREKCCTTRKQEDLESNQEENNQAEGQPLIKQPGAGGQDNTELVVIKELAEGSRDNKDGIQEGGIHIGLEDDKELNEEQKEEQVDLKSTAGETGNQAETSTQREPTTEEVAEEPKEKGGLLKM